MMFFFKNYLKMNLKLKKDLILLKGLEKYKFYILRIDIIGKYDL